MWLLVPVAICVITLIAAALARSVARARVASALAHTSPDAVGESGFVTIGGVPQWIQIRGARRTNPIILVLHGGPGMSYMPLTARFRT
jgi:proline iminopeptidase